MKKMFAKKSLFMWALCLVSISMVVLGLYEESSVIGAMAFAGSVDTDNLGKGEGGEDTDVLAREIERVVLEEGRDRNPLNVIMQHINKKESTKVMNPEYMTISEPELMAVVNEAYSPTATPTKTITLKVSNPMAFCKMNTVAIFGVKSYGGDKGTTGTVNVPLTAIVVERTEDGIKLQVINGKVNASGDAVFADAIPVGTSIVCMGKAETEKAMRTDMSNDIPKNDNNFCQNFMFMLSMTDWAKIHDKNVDWDWSEMFRRTLNDHIVKKELSYLFGAKGKTTVNTGSKNEIVYTCDGVLPKIDKVFDAGGSIDHDKMVDAMSMLFDGNNGSAVRYAFLGSGLYGQFEKYKEATRQLGATSTEVVFGLTFEKMVFGGNTLYLIKHPLLAQIGYSNKGICLDMAHIKEKVFLEYNTTELKLKESGESREEAVSVTEVCCPIVKNRDCHMLITSEPA